MFKITALHRLMALYLSVVYMMFFSFPASGMSDSPQEKEPVGQQQENAKPKIIFKKQVPFPSPTESPTDTTQISIPAADTSRGGIIFKKSYFLKEEMITLLSSKQFRLHGEIRTIGEKGEFLKQALAQNPEAISMVDKAYSKRNIGTTLMVIGGVIALVGLVLPSTWVELGEEQHGSYIETWYWLPGVTLGAIIGGIGFSMHGSLTRNLEKAVKVYNNGLLKENPEKTIE